MLCFFWLERAVQLVPGGDSVLHVGLHGLAELVVSLLGRAGRAACAWWREGVLGEEWGGPCLRLSASPEDGQPGPWPDGPFLTCLLLFCSGPEPGVVSGTCRPSLVGRAGAWGRGDLSETLCCRAPPPPAAAWEPSSSVSCSSSVKCR